MSSSKCLEHEWLISNDEPSQPIDEPNECVNGKRIAENESLPNGFNHNKETLNRSVNLSIDLPSSQESPIKPSEPSNNDHTICQPVADQTASVRNQNGQMESTATDLSCSPVKVEQISAVNVNSPSSSTSSSTNNSTSNCTNSNTANQLTGPLEVHSKSEHNENQPNKPTENDPLSSDSEHLKSSANQEILNAISTSNTNELITTTCTNVTLLTAN